MLCVMQDGWPACDFNEYIYGPRSHWPTEEEVREFESGKKPWPCTTTPVFDASVVFWPQKV